VAWLFFVEPSKDVVGASTVQLPPKTWMARILNMSESAVRLPCHFWAIAHGYMIYANSMTKIKKRQYIRYLEATKHLIYIHLIAHCLCTDLSHHTSYHKLRAQRWGSRYSHCQRGERPKIQGPKWRMRMTSQLWLILRAWWIHRPLGEWVSAVTVAEKGWRSVYESPLLQVHVQVQRYSWGDLGCRFVRNGLCTDYATHPW